MIKAIQHWLVFTDLDGTLLDKHSYSFLAAQPALTRLAEYGIPLILNTSKTIPEVLTLRDALKNTHPFICENGGIIVIPNGYFPTLKSQTNPSAHHSGYQLILLGIDYEYILMQLQSAAESGFHFTGFSQLTAHQLATLCEFSEHDAAQAQVRSCSEPILWQDSKEQLAAFTHWLSTKGLTLVKGGRFHHVMGKQSKGEALKRLKTLYQQDNHHLISTLALGDSANDISMLQEADVAVVIATEQGSMALSSHPNSHFPPEIGPAGWNQAVLDWHNTIEER